MSCMTILFINNANQQIRHQATHKVGCQPGDFCIWSLQSSSGVCVGIYGLTYSLYHPRDINGPLNMLIFQIFHTRNKHIVLFWVGYVSFNDTWSQKEQFSVMYDHVFLKLANHQIRNQATHKVGCQPGGFIWSLYSS